MEFGIQLPEADSGIETAAEHLDAVRGLVRQRPEWRVQEDVYLATFAYSKLAMWRDLELIKSSGIDHPIVSTLAGAQPPQQRDATPSSRPLPLPDDLAGARLDDLLDVRDQFAVLPADYSCQRSLRIPHWRSRKLPTGGHEISPLAVTSIPQWK